MRAQHFLTSCMCKALLRILTSHNVLQRTDDGHCELQYDTNDAKFTRRFYASAIVAVYLTDLMKCANSHLGLSFVSVKTNF